MYMASKRPLPVRPARALATIPGFPDPPLEGLAFSFRLRSGPTGQPPASSPSSETTIRMAPGRDVSELDFKLEETRTILHGRVESLGPSCEPSSGGVRRIRKGNVQISERSTSPLHIHPTAFPSSEWSAKERLITSACTASEASGCTVVCIPCKRPVSLHTRHSRVLFCRMKRCSIVVTFVFSNASTR
eukprot:scaffold1355_cov268-Pinguiococcus_pyrenoidosus.AAC.45